MINAATHAIAEFPIPTATAGLGGITSGPDGNLWFTVSNSSSEGGQIGMINPTTHAIAEFPTPTANAGPGGITVGPDGNLWFTEAFSEEGTPGQIGEVVLVPSITGVVSATHSRKEITAIILGVNEPVDPASMSQRGFYSLDSGVKKRHTLVFSKPARIRAVLYASNSDSVTLELAKPSLGPLQVTVKAGVMAISGTSTQGAFTAVVS